MSAIHSHSLWAACLNQLHLKLSEDDFNTWLRPIQTQQFGHQLYLFVPNHIVLKGIKERFINELQSICNNLSEQPIEIILEIGSVASHTPLVVKQKFDHSISIMPTTDHQLHEGILNSRLNHQFTFSNFVEGNSNRLARAASIQVAEAPGSTYNPLVLYGRAGLGKTHLSHAIGNYILQKNPNTKILYLPSERFVSDMVKALKTNATEKFKNYYRSLDILLIDDIQFFAGKDRSQEEFFHTFNTLLEGQRQIIMTCDRYPKEIVGVEERLKSRLGWGLTIAIEPPDLETRVVILLNKAVETRLDLPEEVAFFVAKRIHSNVRELEGVLKRIGAYSQLMGKAITLELVKEAIKDILALQDRLVTIENIIKTVSEYCHIRVIDILCKKRTAQLVYARQLAMALAKELTNHSLPEIAREFGGRDHTTVLYAIKKIKKERFVDTKLSRDFMKLLRILSSG